MTKATTGEAATQTTPNEFRCALMVDRSTVFEVRYATLGRNAAPYFATDAGRLNPRRTDYTECGQAQNHLLPVGSDARRFWEKWDAKHLCRLTDEERAEVWADLQGLMGRYGHIAITSDGFGADDARDIRFSDIVDLSRREARRRAGA